MKNILTSFCLFFLLPFVAFTQLDTTRMLEYQYNADVGIWLVKNELIQRFSGTVMTEKSEKQYAFLEEKNVVVAHKKEIYNDSGQPITTLDSTQYASGLIIDYSEYFYKENRLDELYLYERKATDNELRLDSKTKYYYNSLGLVERRERTAENDDGIPFLAHVSTYMYDNNRCLIGELNSLTDGHHEQIIYERDANCKEINSIYLSQNYLGEYKPIRKIARHEFFVEGNEILTDSVFYLSIFTTTPQWKFNYANEKESDAEGRLVRSKERMNFSFDKERRWTYHSSGEISSFKERNIGSWADSSYVGYVNILDFDEDGFLIQKQQNWSEDGIPIRTEIFEYDNYCNGNPKFVEHNISTAIINKRYHFEYREADDCPNLSKRFPIKIQPNPSDGKIIVETDALQENSSRVQVYSLLGQLVFDDSVQNQAFGLEVDLSHLNRGNYIISVIGNSFYATEKIVIRNN